MAEQAKTAGQEWRAHWPLVMAAMLGLSFGAMPTATLGLFMEPLQAEFGWTRSQISAGMLIFALVTTPLTPFAGALVDRFGSRAVGLPGIALTGLMFAGFALVGGAIWQWLLAWVLYSFVSLGIRTPVWNTAVSASFSAGRGLAIAIVLCGMAITQAVAPFITHWLIDNYGWRLAYVGMGLGWGGMAALMVLLFFHDFRSRKMMAGAAASGPAVPPVIPGGLTLRQAAHDPRVLRIAAAMFLQSLMGAATVVHMVPLLGLAGLSRAEAAGVAGALGIGALVGKLASGWLVDNFSFRILPFLAFALPGFGYALLMTFGHESVPVSTAAMLLTGMGGGASLQITIYLTTRYAGIRHFGKIFGTISSLMGLAGGLGPLLAGLIFDATAAYTALLLIAIPLALIAGFLVLGLGPYPEFEPESPENAT